jgi:predicted Rossmann-fold nucleotide-binding protein
MALINTNGFYEHLKLHLSQMVQAEMLLEPHAGIAQFVDNPQDALIALENYQAPVIEKWIENIRLANGHFNKPIK